MAKNIAERLKMDHLESIQDLKEELEVETRSPEVKADPRDNEEWTFSFSHKDNRGKVYEGDFTNRILSLGELQLTARLKSKMCGGQPLESFEPNMLIITGAIAHMSYSLKKTPTWAEDLSKLRDPKLIYALWEKVDSHESRYFRFDADSRVDSGEAES